MESPRPDELALATLVAAILDPGSRSHARRDLSQLADLPDRLVRRHLLAPLAYRLGINRFKADYVASALHAERRARFLAEAVGALGDIGVMRLKGIAYADDPSLYADPAERPMTDIDLMVPEGRFRDAVARLESVGYQDDGKRNQRSGANHAVTLRRKESAIDLHRSMLQRGRTGLDLDKIWWAARPVGDGTLRPTPSHEYMIHLGHMARHEMTVSLISFVDADRLAAASEISDLEELAARWRLRRAHRLVQQYIKQLRALEWTAGTLFAGTDELLRGDSPSRSRQVLRKFAIHDGPRDWLSMSWASVRTRLGV